jgi:hypothetical protein
VCRRAIGTAQQRTELGVWLLAQAVDALQMVGVL